MVRTPKYPLVMVDDVFSEEEIDSLMKSVGVLHEAVFRKNINWALLMEVERFMSILKHIPIYPDKYWDFQSVELGIQIYNANLLGGKEAFELLSNSIKPKTLYLGGDIDLYIWKTKNNIHIYNVSSCEIQHVVYYKSSYSGEICFYVPQ